MKTLIYSFLFIFLYSTNTYATIVVVNGLTHIYNANDGEIVTGEILLVNNGETAERVTFSTNEALFSCTKARFFSKNQSHNQSSTNWFEGNLNEITMESRQKFIYRFNIVVPKDSKLKGSYWSMLMIHVEKPISEEFLTQKIGLDTKIRYAVALITNVNAQGKINIIFQDILLKKDVKSNSKKLDIKILNESLFVEGVKLSLEIYTLKGQKINAFTTDRNIAFPRFCRDFLIDISALPRGDYECVLIADARKEFFGTNIRLTIQ